MFTLERRKGTTGNLCVGGPRERVTAEVVGSMLRVTVERRDTLQALQRRGWRLADTPATTPEPSAAPWSEVELEAKTLKELRAIAKDLGIRGRSSLDLPGLISAVIGAKA